MPTRCTTRWGGSARPGRAALCIPPGAPARRAAARWHGPGARWGVAAGGLPQFEAVWPQAALDRAIAAPAAYAERAWSADTALVEILRGRLEGLGPVSVTALAAPLGLLPSELA